MEVAASVTDISCIAQVTLKFINYTLLVNNGWLDFSNFKDSLSNGMLCAPSASNFENRHFEVFDGSPFKLY